MEVVPYTLAENAGLNPIQIVTELRNRHAAGEKYAGINVRKGSITNMLEENIVQPLLVTSSALTLACECVRMILKVRPLWLCRLVQPHMYRSVKIAIIDASAERRFLHARRSTTSYRASEAVCPAKCQCCVARPALVVVAIRPSSTVWS